jgi:hypothetical protein
MSEEHGFIILPIFPKLGFFPDVKLAEKLQNRLWWSSIRIKPPASRAALVRLPQRLVLFGQNSSVLINFFKLLEILETFVYDFGDRLVVAGAFLKKLKLALKSKSELCDSSLYECMNCSSLKKF